jgi:PAT family beta-lactamase induction signal transducer AmpG
LTLHTPPEAAQSQSHRHPPLFLFGIAILAGATAPFSQIAMPFLLRREGVPVATIAGISSLALLPFMLMIAWSPLADMVLSRRNWVFFGNFLSAVLLYAAILVPRPAYLSLFAALLFASNAGYSMAFIALQGMMSVAVPDAKRGKSAAWFQAGNLGGFPLLGGAALWLIERMTLAHAAAAIAVMSFLPSLAVLFIAEAPRSVAASRTAFVAMWREIKAVLPKRKTWIGLLILVSPLGAGAAANLFSGLGVDYGASPDTVLWVTGVPGGVIAAVAGAFTGGALSDRLSRRAARLLAGALLIVVAAAMAASPARPTTFAAGALAYQFVVGMLWATFSALALEMSGTEPMTAGVRMALFNSATVAANVYVTSADGLGYRAMGLRGLLGMDAGLALAAAVALMVLLRALREPPAYRG